MNKKIALSAIAMFAVTLGLGILSPAMASQPDEGGKHKVQLCHFSEAKNIFNATDSTWTNSTAGMVVIDVDNKGKMNGHFDKDKNPRHFNATLGLADFVINATAIPSDPDGEDDCVPAPIVTMTDP